MSTGLWIGCVSNSALVWLFYKHKVCVSKELRWVFSLVNLRQGFFFFWIPKWCFFLTRCLNISPEKKWYFSVILLSNVNLDHVRLYVCCVFQLIEAVIHHLQSFWQLWDPKSSVRPFSKRSRRQCLHSNFQQQLWVNFGLDWERLSRMIFFTYIPWIANRADPSTRFFFSKSRKSLTSKKDFQNHHRKPKTHAKWLCIFCCRLFYQFHIQ